MYKTRTGKYGLGTKHGLRHGLEVRFLSSLPLVL